MTSEDLPISKSEIKRQLQQIKALGTALSKLTDGQIATLPLDEQALAALFELKKLTSNVAKKRQTQYLAKVLSKQDNLVEIEAAYQKMLGQKQQVDAQFHLVERWRERLLSDPKGEITHFIAEFPATESQTLRHLVQKAQKEASQQVNHGAFKALFRYLKQVIINHA